MRDFLRNLRLPGAKPRPYRARVAHSVRSRTSPARPMTGSAAPRRYAVTRVEAPQPRRAIHIPWKRIAFGVAAASAMTAGAYSAAWLLTGDTLRVQTIDVSGAQVGSPYAVAAASGLGGASLLTLDLAEADAAIERVPAVKSATVERDWPRGIRVTVVEHQAWGYWQAAGRVYTIDREGRVLKESRPAPKGAPTIIDLASPLDLADGHVSDPDTVQLVARLVEDGLLADAGITPEAFFFQRDRGLTVVAEEGPAAIFGDSTNYEFKVQALGAVLQELRDEREAAPLQVAEVDLRFGRNVVLR